MNNEAEKHNAIVITYNYAIQSHLPCKGLKTINYKESEMQQAATHYAKLQTQPKINLNLKTTFNFKKTR